MDDTHDGADLETAEAFEAPGVSPRARRSARLRRLGFLGLGIAIAGIVAAVLFSNSTPPGSSDPAPHIGAAGAKLVGLDVNPVRHAPLAPNFALVDQNGRTTSLAQYRGKVVVWSLNDDKCTDLCKLFAQDVVAADRDLASAAKDVVFLAVNANPFYPSPSSVRAWSQQNALERLPNWVYVTGSPSELEKTWNAYHVTVELDRKNRTVVHDAVVYFIDPKGRIRAIGNFTEGSISTAYYAHTMAQMAVDLLPKSEQRHVGGLNVDASTTKGATIGSAAPRFALRRLGSDATSSLKSFEDKPLVVNFWASTCSICTEEMPALAQVDRDFKDKVNFVGIDVADPRRAGEGFARRLGVTYPLLDDHSGTAAAAYRVDALPVTFIISPRGKILARHQGVLTRDELVAVLDMDFPNLPQLGS